MKSNKFRKIIEEEAERDYKKFSASLIPNINNVLGVRLPVLRKIAKDIYKNENWQEFLGISDVKYMEETMLQGFVIDIIKDKPENILEYVKCFIPKIDNWAVCDSFCTGLKFTKTNQDLVWKFIQPYLKSNKEFEIRFGVIMILTYFVDENFIEKDLKILDKINSNDYYAKMAVAWAISVCFAKFPDKTFEYLKISNLNNWTFNKSIQKCRESFRVSKEMKEILNKMKR